MYLRMLTRLPFYLLFISTLTSAQELSDAQINLVSTRLAESAERSWELGVRAQAILELNATRFSVFSRAGVPPSRRVPADMKDPLAPFWDIARQVVDNRGGGSEPRPLVADDGSSADPASVGVPVILANWTDLDGNAKRYADAARSQYDFLFSDKVRRTEDGAISHRSDQLQIWSDSVYMIPPFLAYYGVVTENKDIVEEAYEQIKEYRKLLRNDDTGLWTHIVLGNNQDAGFWATGNAWAAAGMLRVYATIKHSRYGDDMDGKLDDLEDWVKDIHKAVYRNHFDSESRLHNYLDDNKSFYDSAATALMAATVYRASTLMDEHEYIPFAERSRMTLFTPNGGVGSDSNRTVFQDYEFFTSDGWLRPVANPVSVKESLDNGRSPEAQAFAIMMHAAWKEWREQGQEGMSAATSLAGGLKWLMPVYLIAFVVLATLA